MQVTRVNGKSVHIEVIEPHGETNGRDSLSLLHQFPGVASEVIFPPIEKEDSSLYVLLSNGVLALVKPTRIYTNFHKHQGRFIYGQLRTFVVDDFSLAEKIYIGAPIFFNKKLVSVVTCRYDDYDAGLVMFPVSGIRPPGLVSGQFHYDNNVLVSSLKSNMSVYGKHQLLYQSKYMNVKKFALTAAANRLSYRDLPRSVSVFHNAREIIITLTEGEFEIDRVRFDGPMVIPQHG
ncbi:P26A [Rachiplusia nu nucleopolyhedrovirus]|uniref:P26A n=1 Tax=Rachiplusia nu nucleopolyhedrovirus TaxID=2605775 RepID=A0AAE6IQP8_9ABAC|nr:P26A [Rachiplusia nu nucleopolyhedrovirus]QEI03645.1 P26A [Rachiplusia nu nucleopolyhedrovirus]